MKDNLHRKNKLKINVNLKITEKKTFLKKYQKEI